MAKFESAGIEDAYLDRNLAVQAMALLFLDNGYKVGWLADNPNLEEGWDILMIELPGQGQISYHIPQKDKIVKLPDFYGWDGHSLQQKRSRIVEFCKFFQEDAPLIHDSE